MIRFLGTAGVVLSAVALYGIGYGAHFLDTYYHLSNWIGLLGIFIVSIMVGGPAANIFED